MTPPTPAASAATSTTTGAVLVQRHRIANLATAGAIVPKTLTEARDILNAISTEAKALAATSAPPVTLTGASLAAIKQHALSAKPKNLEEARLGFRKIAELLDNVSTATAQATAPAPAVAASTVPISSAVAGKMTDKQLLEHYVELQGAERRAFFAIHGAAIWRAHESACRSRRARS